MTKSDKQNLFMELYESVESKLSGFASAMTRDSEDAHDLVSDTLLSVYENFDKIKNRAMFKPYLFTTASRLQKRKRFRAKLFGKYDPETAERIVDKSASPETNADIAILYEELDKLPAKMKEAIVLFELSGFRIEEIKEIQGGSLSGVKSRLARARTKLAEILRSDEFENKPNNKSKKISEISSAKNIDNSLNKNNLNKNNNAGVNFKKSNFTSIYSGANND